MNCVGLLAVAGLAALALFGTMSTAQAQGPCATNYTLLGPAGSEVGTTTNGYPLLTVFVELGQCEALVSYDEVLTDCTGSTTNHLEYTVDVGEMFDPRLVCTTYFDDFGNQITVCPNSYFLTVANANVHPYDILSSVGSISYLSNGVPVLTVTADPGKCTASVTFDAVNNYCDGSSSTQMVTGTAQPAELANEQGSCVTFFDDFGNQITECYRFKLIAIDTEPPVITCPANITSNAAPGTYSSVVTFAPSVHDNCDPSPTVLCTPPSGSSFTTGTTPVTCKAIDASGNTNACTFTVTINCDADGDHVPDDRDRCPNTPTGSIVNSHGCSIDQLVPCAGPAPGKAWKRHGQYVRAVVVVATDFLRANLITRKQWAQIVTRAALSKCGWNRRCDRVGDADWLRTWDCDRDRDWCRNRDWDRD